MGIYEALYPEEEEEEEEELTPSQRAREKRKAKGLYEALYPEPEPEPEPEKKPPLWKRAIKKAKEVVERLVPKPPEIPKVGLPPVTERLPIKKLPLLDLDTRVAEVSAKLTREGEVAFETPYRQLAAGVGDVLTTAGYASMWLGFDGVGKDLAESGGSLQQLAVEDNLGEFNVKHLYDPRFYATRVTRTLPFSLALLPTAIIGGYAGTGVAATVGLGAFGKLVLGSIGAAALSRPIESALEAGGTYDEALQEGKDIKEATDAANKTFWGNMALASMDAVEFALAFAPVKGGNKFLRLAMKAASLTGNIAGEGMEEVIQRNISRAALGKPIDIASPEAQEEFAIGGLMGAGLSIAGSVYKKIQDNVSSEFPEEKAKLREEFAELETLDKLSEEHPKQVKKIIDDTIKQTVGVPEPLPPKVEKPPVEPKPEVPPVIEEEITKPEEILYHGTTAEMAATIKEVGFVPTTEKAATFGRGIYLTKDKEVAADFPEDYKGKKEVLEVKPVEELRLYTPTEEEVSELIDLVGKEQDVLIKKLLGDKYDGFRITEIRGKKTDQIVIYDPKLLALEKPPVEKPPIEKVPPAKVVEIPKELEPLAKEARKFKSWKAWWDSMDNATRMEVKSKLGLDWKSGELKKDWVKRLDKGFSDFYAQVTKEVPAKPPVAKAPPKVVKPAPPKPKPIAKPVVKAKPVRPKKVVKPKARIFKAQERKQIQKETREAVFLGKDIQKTVRNIDKHTTKVLNQADDPLYTRKLKAVRTELRRNMYQLAGADTGHWKTDYAYLQVARKNLEISDVVDEIEQSIFRIDDVLKPEKAPKTMGYATTQAKPISEFEERKPPKRGTAEFKLFEETKGLIRKYARLIGEGYTPRRAIGIYYRETKNIMVDAINNLSVVAHEVTHFLDATYNISDKLLAIKGFATNGKPIYDPKTFKYRKAITDLYVKYYGGGRTTHKLRKRALEGFATLLQKYVESPQTITNEYPLLVNGFLKRGGEYYHPVMKEIISDLNKIVEKYQGLSNLEKIGARITSEDVSADKADFLNFFEKLRTQLVDAIYPVEVLAKRAKVQFTIDDPSLWLRSYNSVSGLVNNNIASNRGYWTLKGNEIVKRHDFNWKTLVDKAEERKVTNDFAYYLVSRREHFSYLELDELKENLDLLKKEYKKTKPKDRMLVDAEGKTLKDRLVEAKDKHTELKAILDKDGFSREEVDGAYKENKMRFKEEEQLFDALTRADLEFLASENVQLVTPKQLEELSSKQGYASFKRQFYNELLGDFNEMPAQARVGKTKVSSLLRRRGSMKTIINPIFSGIANHSEVMRKGLRQVVYNKLTTIGTSAAFPDLFQGLDLRVAVDKETGVFHYPQEKDPNIIMGRVDYKRKPVLVDRQVKSIIDNILTYRNIETFTRLFAGLSRMFTAGTTGYYPQFAITNFLRDQITAQANTTNKYKTLYSPLVQFGKILANRNSQDYKYYQEYMVMGGERQTFTGWQKLPPNKLFQRIEGEKKGLKKAIALMEKGTDVFSAPAKYSELVTRATEYINARKAGKAQIVALEEAGRLTAPFHHLGKWGGPRGQNFIRGLPFFNATLQVLDQTIRTAETKGGRKRMAFVTMVITAAYLTSLMSLLRADDEQKEQYKDLEGKELANNLYFPHPSGKKLIRIPMSDVFSPLGTIINMIIADNAMKTRYKLSDYVAAATSVIPDQFNLTEPVNAFLSWIPQIFQAGAETVMGVKTWPKIQPLESMALKNMPPAMRTNENTSAFAKWLGKTLNLSPIKIDYLLTGYFGRAIGFVTGKPSAYDFQSSVVRDYYFSYGRRVSGAYDLKEKNDQTYNAYQRGEKKLTSAQAREVYRVKMLTNDFTEAMRDYRKVDIEKDQEEASLLRSEVLTLINQIDLKKEPKGLDKWIRKAKKRRKEKIKEIGEPTSLMTVKKFLSFSIVKKAYAGEPTPMLSMAQKRRSFKIALKLREKHPAWYTKTIGKAGEVSMFGHTIGKWPITTEKDVLPKGVTPTPTPFDDTIKEAFGEDWANATRVLRYATPSGEIKGENTGFKTGKEIDVPNRIDPETGKWSAKAPIKQITNPFTGEEEDSVDRGLFRINNATFYDFLKRKPELLKKYGITKWDDMLNVKKNIQMAKIIFDEQGWGAWYAAPEELR